jgi:hypothetical protein
VVVKAPDGVQLALQADETEQMPWNKQGAELRPLVKIRMVPLHRVHGVVVIVPPARDDAPSLVHCRCMRRPCVRHVGCKSTLIHPLLLEPCARPVVEPGVPGFTPFRAFGDVVSGRFGTFPAGCSPLISMRLQSRDGHSSKLKTRRRSEKQHQRENSLRASQGEVDAYASKPVAQLCSIPRPPAFILPNFPHLLGGLPWEKR